MRFSNRELRLILYSFFVGAIVATLVNQIINQRSPPRARRRCPPLKESQEKFCPQCPKLECPKCKSLDGGSAVQQVPKTLKSFLSRHWEVMHNDAVVFAKTRMKSVPSYVISLHPSEKDPEISHTLIERGGWEEELIVRMCREMNKAPSDAYFVDVGAYVGSLSLGVSACGHKVIAFEPMTRNAFLLKESVFLNQLSSERFTIHNMALGNVNGKACFLASSGNQGDGRFVSGGDEGHECNSHEDTIKMARLDDVLQEDFIIWTLHIDAQGFEPAVLAGAEWILTGPNPPRYLHVRLGSVYSQEVMEVSRGLVETLAWLKEIGYALKNAANEPIRDLSKFVWSLGHEKSYVFGVYGMP
ncbi:uncharacterized protein LOC119719078 [Patiria miniata]|uniref:Methyltransferase FkbM domain-containing protein n=1 Tax=Patiria miniata TaxID=46514 RepID=A0A913YX07_PATMI|nr:uncharacterized protein LOC119719078 [Patiria miniata]